MQQRLNVVEIPESRNEAYNLAIKFALFAVTFAAIGYFKFGKEDA